MASFERSVKTKMKKCRELENCRVAMPRIRKENENAIFMMR